MCDLSKSCKIELLELFKKFPLLVPSDRYTRWEGYITVENLRCALLLKVPNYPSLSDLELFACDKVISLLNPIKPRDFSTLLEYLIAIERCIREGNVTDANKNTLNPKFLPTYVSILKDIECSVGKENVEEVDVHQRRVKMTYVDFDDISHSIRVNFDLRYPNVPLQILEIDLPDEAVSKLKEFSTLGAIYSEFKECVDSLQQFWAVCHQLEEEAWVVEPRDPLRRHTHRRVYISDNLSVQVTMNPFSPFSLPDIKFLGSLGAVTKARTMYQKKLEEVGWDEGVSLADNLSELIAGGPLVQKPAADTSCQKELCIICYDDDVSPPPARWCSNQNCSGRFHHACLIMWFNSVPTSKTTFDHISGPCPHCDEKIYCPLSLN